jgi:hypothetical protein
MWSGTYSRKWFRAMLGYVWLTSRSTSRPCQDACGKGGDKTKRLSFDYWVKLKSVSLEWRQLSTVWPMHLLSLWLELIVTESTDPIGTEEAWISFLKVSLTIPVLIQLMAETFKNVGSSKSTIRTTKLLCFKVSTPIALCLAEIPFRQKKLHLIYDWDHRHYDVMTNLKGAVAKNYLCNGCVASYDSTYKCGKVCSLYTATPPCIKDQSKNCSTYNRRILREEYFQNHLTHNVKVKLVSQWWQVCRTCSYLVNGDWKHECFRNFEIFVIRSKLQANFARWLHWKLASFYVFFNTECTQGLEKRDGSLSMYRNSSVLSKCVLNVKTWMIWESIFNSVVSVFKRSGKTRR